MVALSTKAESELKGLVEGGLRKIEEHIGGLGDRVKTLEEKKDAPTLDEIKAAMGSENIAESISAQVEGVKTQLTDRLDQIEAQFAARPIVSPDEADHDLAKHVMESKQFKGIPRREDGRFAQMLGWHHIPNVPSLHVRPKGAKATILGQNELLALVSPYYRASPAETLIEYSDIASWIPRVGTGGQEPYYYTRETEVSRLGFLHTKLAAAVAAVDTTITVDNGEGITKGSILRIHAAAGIFNVEVLSVSGTTVTLTAAAGSTAAIDEDVTSENYGGTAEQGTKPYGIMSYERKTLNLKTLAIMAALTQQRLDSLPQFQGFVDRKLLFRARRNLSYHFLYGDDTEADQWAGFASDPDAQAYLWSQGESKDTRADAMFRAAALIFSGNPITFHMAIRTWNKVLLEKNASDSHYMMTNFGPVVVVNLPTVRSIGPYMVNIDGAVKLDDFFAIDHMIASEWVDKEASAFSVGFINDDFEKNIVRVRYEDTGNHAIQTPLATVVGEFNSQPA